MSDQQIRAAQRALAQNPENSQLAVNLVRLAMQNGQVDSILIQQIASLGDPVGLILFPNEDQLKIREFLEQNLEPRSWLRFAIYCFKKAAPIWRDIYPENDRPEAVIKAVEDWLNNSSADTAWATLEAINRPGGGSAGNAAYYIGDTVYPIYSPEAYATPNSYALGNVYSAICISSKALRTTNEQLLIDFLTKDVRIR